MAYGEVAPGVEPSLNVYVNAGVAEAAPAIAGPLPWTARIESDDEIACRGEIAVDDYIVAEQNLALARQFRSDAGRGGRIVADFAGAALVTTSFAGREGRGAFLDADTILQSLRYPRTANGQPTDITQPDANADFPEAGQYLVHADQQFNPATNSGEICMSEEKALRYARDYTLLAEGSVEDIWRTREGITDPSVRRVSLFYGASFQRSSTERVRVHAAQVVYGTPYVVGGEAVGRIP